MISNEVRKVAHVVPPYNPVPPVNSAGTELRVYNVAKHARRFRPVVYSGWFPGLLEKEIIDGVCYERIRIGRLYRRLFQKIVPWDPYSFNDRVGRRITQLKPEIVHLHNEPKLLRRTWRYMKRCRCVVLLHAANEKEMDLHLLNHVDHFIACSRYIAGWIHSAYGVPEERIDTLYTGTDTVRIRPQWEVPETRKAMRSEFGLNERDKVILFAGRVVREKGVEELIKAFDLMKHEPENDLLKLVLAGDVRKNSDPKDRKGVYGKKIQGMVRGRRDIILAGTIAPVRMPDFYAMGDVCVLPALWNDPFPTVLLEAAAAGLPIVTSRAGGIPEFIQDGLNGILVQDACNIRDLCEKILILLRNTEYAGSIARNARRMVEDSFSWDTVAKNFEELYLKMLHVHCKAG